MGDKVPSWTLIWESPRAAMCIPIWVPKPVHTVAYFQTLGRVGAGGGGSDDIRASGGPDWRGPGPWNLTVAAEQQDPLVSDQRASNTHLVEGALNLKLLPKEH